MTPKLTGTRQSNHITLRVTFTANIHTRRCSSSTRNTNEILKKKLWCGVKMMMLSHFRNAEVSHSRYNMLSMMLVAFACFNVFSCFCLHFGGKEHCDLMFERFRILPTLKSQGKIGKKGRQISEALPHQSKYWFFFILKHHYSKNKCHTTRNAFVRDN